MAPRHVRTRKIAVVGNRSFPIDVAVGVQVVDILREYPDDTVFLTRGSPGFDEFIMLAAPLIGRRCFAYPGKGGTDNLERDSELVKDADEVLAFFEVNSIGDTKTGTAMIVEKSLNAKKPTRAYTVVDGRLIWAGETDIGPKGSHG
jgi:hypothetical protein